MSSFSTLKHDSRQSMLTRIIQRIVTDACIITEQADLSVITAGQREKPDQATHDDMGVHNHSKKLDLIQVLSGRKLQISTL